ncbi:MAG: PilZ domain [Planctomycetota bacterium]
MKKVLVPDDAPNMDVWFRHIADLFTREDAEVRSSRKVLRAAAERSAPVGFGPADSETCPKPDHGSIESIEGDSILVLTPRSGGVRFIKGEHLTICIAAPAGFDVGEVKVLGEWDRHDKAGHRGGVRVTLPRILEHVQRREHHRVPVAFDLSPRVTLERDEPRGPLGGGEILDISESGARIRVQLLEPVTAGTKMVFHANCPAPFPSFTATAEVVHVIQVKDHDRTILGVRFLEEHAELGRAIHALELKRAQRLRK